MTVDDLILALTEQGFHAHAGGGSQWDHQGLHQSARDEANSRKASNCASSNATELEIARFVLLDQGGRVVTYTNHSRNGDGIGSAVDCLRTMFKETLHHRPQDWPLYGVTYRGHYADMPMTEQRKLFNGIAAAASKLIGYDDSRLQNNWIREDYIRRQYPNKLVLSGLEVNLTATGAIDTELVAESQCQVFVLSLHPNYDTHGFGVIRQDPATYSRFVAEAIRRHRPHVFAHPGYGCSLSGDDSWDKETNFRQQLDWDLIARACIEADTLLEVNYSHIYHRVCNELVDPEKFPLMSTSWASKAGEWHNQTPILNDHLVMAQLEPMFEQGLVLVLNSDRHMIPGSNAVPGRYDEWKDWYARWLSTRVEIWGVQLANCWPLDLVKQFFSNRY